MTKHLIECDQCKEVFYVEDLRSTSGLGCILEFTVKHLLKSGDVQRVDLCSVKCLEEFSKKEAAKA